MILRKLVAVSVCGAGLCIVNVAVGQQVQPQTPQPLKAQGQLPTGLPAICLSHLID